MPGVQRGSEADEHHCLCDQRAGLHLKSWSLLEDGQYLTIQIYCSCSSLFLVLLILCRPDLMSHCQGNNQRSLAFDKESVFNLSDCPDIDGFVVSIEKTRWIRKSNVPLDH